MSFRIGNGLDFHRLVKDISRPLLLGGYEIPGEWALAGHSDADVLLHALCDAIAGALALGDIGSYFPDSSAENKNRNSVDFLNKYLALMKERGYAFVNMDFTLVGERPKILPHRKGIQNRLSELTTLSPNAIGLKATTTEKMGALGRAEGLSCLAVVLLEGTPKNGSTRRQVGNRGHHQKWG